MIRRLGLLAVAACGLGVADPRLDRALIARAHMQQNFDLLRATERLLVRGKLDEARRFAGAIGFRWDEPKRGPFAARMVEVRSRAVQLARASDLDAALRAVAKLGEACGDCHAELSASAVFAAAPPPPADQPTAGARMARHRWAADRLWEGVVGNAQASWDAGLDVLASQPVELPADRVAAGRSLQQRALAARRPGTARFANRATTYGELLIECAHCHAHR